jgi:hypothetical protein
MLRFRQDMQSRPRPLAHSNVSLNTCSHCTLPPHADRESSLVGARRLVPLLLAALVLTICPAGLRAHTLPISYLTVVTDTDYIHLELMFNPFELSFFSELDKNKNGQLEPAELEAQKEELTKRLVGSLKLRVNGKRIQAEVSGLIPDVDSHHLTLRAHYHADARRAAVTIESTLPRITSGSHLTLVTFSRGGQPQLAQLDTQSSKVTFEGEKVERAAVTAGSLRQKAPPIGPFLLLLAIPGMAIFAFAMWMIHIAREPQLKTQPPV